MKRYLPWNNIPVVDSNFLSGIHLKSVIEVILQIKHSISRINFRAPRFRYSIAKSRSTTSYLSTDIYIDSLRELSISTFDDGEVVYTSRCEICEITREWIYSYGIFISCIHFTIKKERPHV